MAGIYIHIPFCAYACSYCDFYFTTHLQFKQQFLKALSSEIISRANFLEGEVVDTVYFGGGTPSQLEVDEIDAILAQIRQLFDVSTNSEITLEANPDDINIDVAKGLQQIGINRLSMGVQSFHQSELELMGRQHSAQKAIEAVEAIREAGINNFSIDLIYGVPGSNLDSWKYNVEQALNLNPPHLSAYCLTVEPGTRLEYQIKKGRLKLAEEAIIVKQFEVLQSMSEAAGYAHYEISNFALPGKLSQHNTSYWEGKKYLGLGPSAHSFDGINRFHNLANTPKYVAAASQGENVIVMEELNDHDRYNERVMTRLRTHWGIDLNAIEQDYGSGKYSYLMQEANAYLDSGDLILKEGNLKLTSSGKLIADRIASDLFWTVD